MPNQVRHHPALQNLLIPLEHPTYRRLLTANALWWHALIMQNTTIGWLVLELTDSAWSVSLMSFWRHVPFLLLGLFSGPIIDRLGRRVTILSSQALFVIGNMLVVWLLWQQSLSYWLLAMVAFASGAALTLDWSARSALVPDIVGKERVVDAILLESLILAIAGISGPFSTGWLIDLLGPAGCFAGVVSLAGVSLLIWRALFQQRIPQTNRADHLPLQTILRQGIRYIGHHQTLLAVVLISVVNNLFIFPAIALLPVFARDILHQDAVGLGLLGAASGIGFFIGLGLISLLRQMVSDDWLYAGGALLQALTMAAFAISTSYPLSWVLLLISGTGYAAFVTLRSGIVLAATDDHMRSWAMGMVALSIGADPPAELSTGFLAETFGPMATVGVQATVAAVLIILIVIRLPELRQAKKTREVIG